jgi:Gpi18-like mannosyltransferase
MHAPNIYVFVPESFFRSGLILGLLTTLVITVAWITVYAGRIKEFTPPMILLCALVSVAFVPFFLPKMHDRYFYLAEVFSFLIAFYFRRGWHLAAGYQLVSGLVYLVFLHSSLVRTRMETPFDVSIVMLAAVINTILMGFLFWKQWKLTAGSNSETPLSI